MSTATKYSLEAPKEGSSVYSDDVLYEPRREAFKLLEFAKANNNPDCIIRTSPDTFVDKQQWSIKHLIGLDKRLKTMADELKVVHALPIQRYCWPQLHLSAFPFVCIAPKSSGKTFTHLFYMVTQCIGDTPFCKTDEIITGSVMNAFSINNLAASKPSAPTNMANLSSTSEFDFNDLDLKHKDAKLAASQPDDGQHSDPEQAKREADLNSWGIADIGNPDDLVVHPKYIVICSSQNHVETLAREIDRMKLAAFGDKILLKRRRKLPPKVSVIDVHLDDEELSYRVLTNCEILLATPGALHKCINLEHIDFTKCRRLIFDDIDLSLQLHNSSIRDILKHYVVQMSDISEHPVTGNGYDYNAKALTTCKVHMFSRKWTDLMKQSIHTVFKQHILIFGSIAEASIYGNLRYEVEYVKHNDEVFSKLKALVERYECTRKASDIMAITCKTNAAASVILSKLNNSHQNKAIVSERDSILSLKLTGKSLKGPVYIISDRALEFTIEDLNSVTHLVHFDLPEEHIMFDQRFRLMHRHLIATDSVNMSTTVFLAPATGNEFLKELFDVLARSSTTLRSTKLELKDFIGQLSSNICWRWASTGLCRLEKLSRDDRFGSFCPDRHSTLPNELLLDHNQNERWPKGGQVGMTITNLVNPNEFYFWFEAYRNKESHMKRWQKFEQSGSEFMQSLQVKLNKFNDTRPGRVPLAEFNQEQVYGFYCAQEARVDRIVILKKLNFDNIDLVKARPQNLNIPEIQFKKRYDAEYTTLVEVFKIDYGIKLHVHLKNIFSLPQSLASIERQCYRGFHLGVKPTDNEPDWLYKAKKSFFEFVSADQSKKVTAWIRLQNGRCFWFDNMVVSRRLPEEIATRQSFKTYPHEELIKKNLALKCSSEPSCLPASDRLETLCKWQTDEVAQYAQWAFLRKDQDAIDIFLLHVVGRRMLDLHVRLAAYNKQLINLERKIHQDYQNNQLQSLSYFAEGIFCVVRLMQGADPETNQPIYEFNRCRINKVIVCQSIEDPESVDNGTTLQQFKYQVECLDHGDQYTVPSKSLFLAKPDYIKLLPFQAIRCRMADVNLNIFSDAPLLHAIKEQIYDATRTESGFMMTIKCRLKEHQNEEVYLYLPYDEGGTHIPLIALFEQNGVEICSNDDTELRKFVEFRKADDDEVADEMESMQTEKDYLMTLLIDSILMDIVTNELEAKAKGVALLDDEEDDEEKDEQIEELLVNGLSSVSME